jgi:hypothetical protein
MATQPTGEGTGGYDECLREQLDGGRAPGVASRTQDPSPSARSLVTRSLSPRAELDIHRRPAR